MRLGSTTTLTRGITAAASVSTTERLVFIKKVYSLLAMSMLTAAVGAYLGSGPLYLLVAPNMMLFFCTTNWAYIFCFFCCSEARFEYHCTF
jgi:FtsH-binding integral membrane protein